jgi:hypothetical protein
MDPANHGTAPCAHLRHKGMYVLTVVDPDDTSFYDKYDATSYWCTRTQKPYGPDNEPAHADACRAGRTCCG